MIAGQPEKEYEKAAVKKSQLSFALSQKMNLLCLLVLNIKPLGIFKSNTLARCDYALQEYEERIFPHEYLALL